MNFVIPDFVDIIKKIQNIIKNNLKYNKCVLIDDSKSLVDMYKKVGMNNIKINDCEKEIRDVLLKFIN